MAKMLEEDEAWPEEIALGVEAEDGRIWIWDVDSVAYLKQVGTFRPVIRQNIMLLEVEEKYEMLANVFISFDHDDQKQVAGFKLLKSNKNHPLDFQDHSLKEPVKDQSGRVIRVPPSDARSKPVRDAIIRKFENASKLVVLIGDDTHSSQWVAWEVDTFFGMKKKVSGEKTWKRIRGMTLKDSESATVPSCLGGQSTKVLKWDPEELD